MRIAILSANHRLYSTKRLVEAARKKGHKVRVLNHLRCFMDITAQKPTIHYGKHEFNQSYFDAVIPRIGASVTAYGTSVVRQFEMMNVFCVNGSNEIICSRDKLRSLQLMSTSGVELPTTAYAHSVMDVNGIIKEVGGAPLIIKLLEGTQGSGVVLAQSNKAAQSVIQAFMTLDADILVQEFIEEAGGADIRCFVINGEVVAAMERQAPEGEFRSNLHLGGRGVAVELTDEERYTAIQAAKVMGLNVAGVDIIRSKRGPMVLEVNSAPGLEGIEKTTGIDVAVKIIEFIEQYHEANFTKVK